MRQRLGKIWLAFGESQQTWLPRKRQKLWRIEPKLDIHDESVVTPIVPFRFLYEGSRINDDDTPASLDMVDNGTFQTLSI